MKSHRVCICAVLAVLAGAASLVAKGNTTRIDVTGGQLTKPISITDARILSQFNVWSGRGTYSNGVEGTDGFIIDWPAGVVASRPSGLPRYEVSFFVKYANRPLESQADQLAYVVHYEWDPAHAVGYVYLPGRSDSHYGLNVSSIHRNGLNGHWFRSTRAWQDALAPLLQQAR